MMGMMDWANSNIFFIFLSCMANYASSFDIRASFKSKILIQSSCS